MRSTLCAVALFGVACAPAAESDHVRLAADAHLPYTWQVSTCADDASCQPRVVEIVDVDVDDAGVVAIGDLGDTTVELWAGAPGETAVTFAGREDDALVLEVEVVTASVRLDAPLVGSPHLVLPGAEDRIPYALVDDAGRPLEGIADVEVTARGLAGVVVESEAQARAVRVHVPDKQGAFTLVPMQWGEPLEVEVVDPSAIDGIMLAPHGLDARTADLVPLVDGVPVRAGTVAHRIEPADLEAGCTVDATAWGRGAAEGAWQVRVSGESCDLRVQLPEADGGAGLDVVVVWD